MLLCNENAIQAGGGYTISNSLRFQSASSQYVSKTFGTPTNAIKWTVSFWIKRGTMSVQSDIFGSYVNTSTYGVLDFLSNNTLGIYATNAVAWVTTANVFRDPSAWYHIVVRYDSANATASNRVNIYVNGVECTYSVDNRASYPSQASGWNRAATANGIGAGLGSVNGYIDGYIAEFNHIDGQALTPSSFGATTALTGQWSATKYTGTYGTNGFYLPFSNGTSTTTLGADSSGNSNNWTLTSFTRSAGVSDCWMYDVPSGNGGASATQPSSNYCVMNPLRPSSYGAAIITKANLNTAQNTTAYVAATSTLPVNSGKWYWEVTCGVAGFVTSIGITTSVTANGPGATGSSTYHYDGTKYTGGVNSAYGASYTNGDVLGFALDLTAGTLVCYKNNASQGTLVSSLTGDVYAYATMYGTNNVDYNFGNRSFTYTPPSGFKSLCTANLAATTIAIGNQYMDATLYTGTGSAAVITNIGGFQPDLVWQKARAEIAGHRLVDSVRGTSKVLYSNATTAETTTSGVVNSFNSSGFTGGGSDVVTGGLTAVAWQWKAGGTAVTNTSGSITSTVSANTTSGFSIVKWTGTGATGTIGHGLGAAPKFLILKDTTNAYNWYVITTATGSNIQFEGLNTTAASTASSIFTTTSSLITSVPATASQNTSGAQMLLYCFAAIAGFSAFGSYTGNGSTDGTFVYTGFRPKYVMFKRTDSAGGWIILDSARSPNNVAQNILEAQSAGADTGSTYNVVDFLSNGFKFRIAGDPNTLGAPNIYMAFAESPFALSNAR